MIPPQLEMGKEAGRMMKKAAGIYTDVGTM